MYTIEHLTIDGFHHINHAEYDFNNLNYLQGLNGAGKSTVLQAIQLGLLGYIPGTDKNKTAIFRHCNSDMLRVGLILKPSVIITRTWMRSGNNIVITCNVQPKDFDVESLIKDIELPIFNFNDFIGMTANKLKDWFINFLPKNEVEIDWNKELREAVCKSNLITVEDSIVDDAVAKIESCGLSGVDQVRWANDYFKNQVSLKKSEVAQTEGTIRSLVYYEDIPDGMSEEYIQNQLAEKEIQRKSARDYEESVKLVESLKSQLNDVSFADSIVADTDYQNYMKIVTADKTTAEIVANNLKQIDIEIYDIQSAIKDADAEITRISTLSTNDLCPATMKPCETIRLMADKNAQKIEQLKQEKLNYKNKLDELNNQRYSAWETQKQIDAEIAGYGIKIDAIKSAYSVKNNIDNIMNGLTVPEHNLLVIESEIKELQDQLIKVKANQIYNQSIDKFNAIKAKAQQELDTYKVWVNLTGVNDLQIRVNAVDPFAVLGEDMYPTIKDILELSRGVNFITQGKSNSFDFGIIDEQNRFVSYDLLSSGEKCVFVLAMLISIIRTSKNSLPLILIDDLFDHLDDTRIVKLFNKLVDGYSDIQFIFAGVKDVNGLTDHDCVIAIRR